MRRKRMNFLCNERMTTKLRLHFLGRVLVPEEPVDLPIGESVEI